MNINNYYSETVNAINNQDQFEELVDFIIIGSQITGCIYLSGDGIRLCLFDTPVPLPDDEDYK